MSSTQESPIPQGKYLPAVRHSDLIYTSGMTPRKDGKLIFSGKINAKNPIASYEEALRLATQNALTAAENCLKKGEKISQVLMLGVYLNTDQDFTAHAKIADYASNFIVEKLGVNGLGSRAAIGVATLPSDATVEITMIAKVD